MSENVTDEAIEQRLAQVATLRAEVAADESPRYKTNRTWTWVEGDLSRSINLAVVSDVGLLLKMAAHLHAAESAYLQVAESLRIAAPAYTWNGASAADWKHDIYARIQQIQVKAKHEKLRALEGRLAKLISEDRRREKELEAIDAEMAAG